MLIEFSIANFRSFSGKQTFSMVADKPHKKLRNVLETGFNAAPKVMELAAIYGPNGSGKSNFVQALAFFSSFVISSSKDRQEGEPIGVTPFLFSEKTSHAPSEFEIVFVHKGYLFEYGFSVDSTRVYDEWLFATPQNSLKQSAQKWFVRDPENHKKDSFVRKELKGAKEVWKQSTRDNALFLSTAVQLGSEDFGVPFEWIKHYLNPNNHRIPPAFSTKIASGSQKGKNDILKFIKLFDVSFDDFEINEKQLTADDFLGLPEELVKKLHNSIRIQIDTYHQIDGKKYRLPFEDQSDGTRNLFAYAGPVLDVLEHGYVLIVDELHRSLHPYALEGVMRLFADPAINRHNAQLIFTTHNTAPMKHLDRDQIWLMDKGCDGGTEFHSIAEFEGRPDEAVEKRYLAGRYGAVPNIGEFYHE